VRTQEERETASLGFETRRRNETASCAASCAMSLDLRLQTVDAALPDARPDSDSLPDAMSDEPGVGWHLARCPHCGVPNGLSATSCWGCEADLSVIERFHLDRAPPSDAWMREQANESLALLPSPV
jgi:hypothetical protein